MKLLFAKQLIYKLLSFCLLSQFIIGNIQLKAQSFDLVGVSDLNPIFEDGYKMPENNNSVSLFGIRNEVLSGQAVIIARNDLKSVNVTVSDLTNNATEHVIPARNIEMNFVGSIPLLNNAGNQPDNAVVRKAPARFPDYLMAEKQIDINKGNYQAVWFTVIVPEDASAGNYSGKITVKSDNGEQSLPLNLEVYPLTMPQKRNLKVTEWYSTGNFEKFHGIKEEYSEEWFKMLGKYAENMVSHRQNIFRVPANSIIIRKSVTGELEFDFSRFDQIARIFWNTGKMDYLETGELATFGEERFASTEVKFKDFRVLDSNGNSIIMSGEDVIPYFLPSLENHLRQKGWLDKTLFHVKDEPSHHNAVEWIKISKAIHQYAPDLKRIDALCTSFVLDDIEIAVPKLDALDAGYSVFKKWQDKGNELWFYTVGIFQGSMYPNKTIDMPVIGSRILHWLNYKYDTPGYLHWGWNQWVDNPYSDTGQHTGDGYHVYPVKDGVVNSIRWEQMRNGIQDYECFKMYEDKIKILKDSLGSRFSWINPTQRSKEIASRVVADLVRHSNDPEVLYQAKRDLLNELVDFENSPRLYIQTNPEEHGSVINRSVVELCGWTEPGTEITINKRKFPVAHDGLIMGRFLIYVGGKLEITAKKDNKSKTIVRNFNVTY